MSTIGEVVRGNVSSLFGRFRPPAGMTAEGIAAVKAERLEYGSRLTTQLKTINADAAKVERETRRVFREISAQPTSEPMPTPDSICERVRSSCEKVDRRTPCPACMKLSEGSRVFSDTAPMRVEKHGALPVENEWWCDGHYAALTWYANRQDRFADGLKFPYPPPMCLIPSDAHRIGAAPEDYAEYTDGVLMCELALYIRDYIEGLSGETLLDLPRVHA